MTTSRPVCSTCGGAVRYQWDPPGFIHAEAAEHPVRDPKWITQAGEAVTDSLAALHVYDEVVPFTDAEADRAQSYLAHDRKVREQIELVRRHTP